jgi:dephospho-CoA kinase
MPSLAIGLTGNIGSGKTEATKLFASQGAIVVYSDQLAKDILDTNADVKRRVKKEFGDEIYQSDGKLDRKTMARAIFFDESRREKLEQIVHPYVLNSIEETIHSFRKSSKNKLLIVEAALHYESGAEELFDYMIVIDADEKQRLDRIVQRDGVSRNEIMQRMRSQLPAKDKIARADFVIHNNGDRAGLKEKCIFIYRLLKGITTTPSVPEE